MFGISDAGLFLASKKEKKIEDIFTYSEFQKIKFLWRANKHLTRPSDATTTARDALDIGIFNKETRFNNTVRIFLKPLDKVNEIIRFTDGTNSIDTQITPTTFNVAGVSVSWTWNGGEICIERDASTRDYNLYEKNNLVATVNNTTAVYYAQIFSQLLGLYSHVLVVDSTDTFDVDYAIFQKMLKEVWNATYIST